MPYTLRFPSEENVTGKLAHCIVGPGQRHGRSKGWFGDGEFLVASSVQLCGLPEHVGDHAAK